MRRAFSAIFVLALRSGLARVACLSATPPGWSGRTNRHGRSSLSRPSEPVRGGRDTACRTEGKANPQVVAVPLLFWYSRTDGLGDGVFYNDQILGCDTDGDGLITLAEAEAFRGASRVEAQAAKSAGSAKGRGWPDRRGVSDRTGRADRDAAQVVLEQRLDPPRAASILPAPLECARTAPESFEPTTAEEPHDSSRRRPAGPRLQAQAAAVVELRHGFSGVRR